MQQQEVVSNQSRIREMSAEELLDELQHMGEVPDTTGAWPDHVRLIRACYRQITNTELTIETPGITIAQAAILKAEQELAKQTPAEA